MYGYIVIPWLKSMFPDVHIVDFLHAEQWEWRDGGYPRNAVALVFGELLFSHFSLCHYELLTISK